MKIQDISLDSIRISFQLVTELIEEIEVEFQNIKAGSKFDENDLGDIQEKFEDIDREIDSWKRLIKNEVKG